MKKNIFRKFSIISVFVNVACMYSTYKIHAVKGIFFGHCTRVSLNEIDNYNSEKKISINSDFMNVACLYSTCNIQGFMVICWKVTIKLDSPQWSRSPVPFTTPIPRRPL